MSTFWEKYWFLIPAFILFFISLFAIIRSTSRYQELSQRKYSKVIIFFFYLTIGQLIIGIGEEFLDPYNKIKGKKSPTNISALIYVIVEYQIYAYLLLTFIKWIKINRYLKLFRLFMLLLAPILWFGNLNMAQFMSYYTLAEAVTILPGCLFYFYEILSGPPILKLNKEPPFWIVTGIVFLFVCLIPAYIGIAITEDFWPIAVMDYIGYIIISILFLKGITCKTLQVAWSILLLPLQ